MDLLLLSHHKIKQSCFLKPPYCDLIPKLMSFYRQFSPLSRSRNFAGMSLILKFQPPACFQKASYLAMNIFILIISFIFFIVVVVAQIIALINDSGLKIGRSCGITMLFCNIAPFLTLGLVQCNISNINSLFWNQGTRRLNCSKDTAIL